MILKDKCTKGLKPRKVFIITVTKWIITVSEFEASFNDSIWNESANITYSFGEDHYNITLDFGIDYDNDTNADMLMEEVFSTLELLDPENESQTKDEKNLK